VLKLATKTNDDPLRGELAVAIDARTSAENTLHDARAKLARASLMVNKASAALDDAKQECARVRQVSIAAAAGGETPDQAPMKRARLVEADTNDGLEIAKGAHDAIEATIPDLEYELEAARRRVETAAKTMIVSVAPALIAKSKAQVAALYETRCALSFLHLSFSRLPPDDDTRACEGYATMAVAPGDARDASEWHEALARLMNDADAPLPPI
jgi:hypothetical protein